MLELRSDFGFEQLVDVEYTTDRRNQLNLNDGLAIELGASFLPLAGNRLATRVAAGFKIDMLRASNGNALFTAVPLDVVETAYVGPLRLGAGASVLLGRASGGTGSSATQDSGSTLRRARCSRPSGSWRLGAGPASASGRAGTGSRGTG